MKTCKEPGRLGEVTVRELTVRITRSAKCSFLLSNIYWNIDGPVKFRSSYFYFAMTSVLVRAFRKPAVFATPRDR